MPPQPLSALLPHTDAPSRSGDADPLIAAVRQDSRQIAPGDCFVAVPGFRVDGHDYIADALSNGAAAVVVQSDRRPQWAPQLSDAAIPVIEVDDARRALADLAAAWHDFPARKLTIVGVTGTDGKTTTTYFIHAMLQAAGHRTGLINGVEFQIGGNWTRNDSGETTPEADNIQAALAQMVERRDTHAVLEVSSHGLALHRVRHTNPAVAVFTGLSDDHLDFHRTRDAYLDAKLDLFRSLDDRPNHPPDAPIAAIVRAEDPLRDTIAAAHHQLTRHVTAIADPPVAADVSVAALSRSPTATDVRVVTPSGALGARLPLPGDYNLGNLALAAGAAWTLGAGPVPIQRAVANLRPVPGRMETIDEGQPFDIIVDAAATAPALELAISALKHNLTGRLILVFGAAGERDPARRSGMGAVAARLADISVVTSENPRSEDPAAIVREIADAMREHGAADRLREQPDRRAAIRAALSDAQPGDLVLIAGKGAEPTLIYPDRVEDWDDRRVAREEIQRLLSPDDASA